MAARREGPQAVGSTVRESRPRRFERCAIRMTTRVRRREKQSPPRPIPCLRSGVPNYAARRKLYCTVSASMPVRSFARCFMALTGPALLTPSLSSRAHLLGWFTDLTQSVTQERIAPWESWVCSGLRSSFCSFSRHSSLDRIAINPLLSRSVLFPLQALQTLPLAAGAAA